MTAAVGPPVHSSARTVHMLRIDYSPTYPAPMQQISRIGTFAAVFGSMMSGSIAWSAICGVSIRELIDMESIGGNEYTSAVIYGDIAGVGGVELLSMADSSERPKDGVLAMEERFWKCFKI